MDKLIAIAVTLAVLTVSTGQLPKVATSTKYSSTKAYQRFTSLEWGQAMLLPNK